MSEVEKTFVIPEPSTPLTKEMNTAMNPLSLAIAKETGQLDTVSSELRAAPVYEQTYLEVGGRKIPVSIS